MKFWYRYWSGKLATLGRQIHRLPLWLVLGILLSSFPVTRGAASAAAGDLTALSDSEAEVKSPSSKPDKGPKPWFLEALGMTIGLVATVLGIGIGCLAIWCDYRKRSELIRACYQERMAALERGLELPPLPPEIFEDGQSSATKVRSTGLKSGLVLLSLGTGLWLFLSPKNPGFLHPSVGAIPGAIGVGFLVYYAIEGRKRGAVDSTTVSGR